MGVVASVANFFAPLLTTAIPSTTVSWATTGVAAGVAGGIAGGVCGSGHCDKRADVKNVIFHVLYKADALGHLDETEFAGNFTGMVPTIKDVDNVAGTGSLEWPGSETSGNVTGLHSGNDFVPNGTFSTYLPGLGRQHVAGKWIRIEMKDRFVPSCNLHKKDEISDVVGEGLEAVADAASDVIDGIQDHDSAGTIAMDIIADTAGLLSAVARLAEKVGADPTTGDDPEKPENKLYAMRDAISRRSSKRAIWMRVVT